MRLYTCRGSVRGSCGIKHRSIGAALRCQDQDQRACASQGGYSDRYTSLASGGRLTADEEDTIFRLREEAT
jgi:hypothetical protein